jgi:hypothetical protein
MKDEIWREGEKKSFIGAMKDKIWREGEKKVLHRCYEGQNLVGGRKKSPSSVQ